MGAALSTSGALDLLMQHEEEIDSADLANTENIPFRDLGLQVLQEVAAQVWTSWEWDFIQGQWQVSADTTGYIAMPIDFSNIGEFGGLFHSATGVEIRWLSPHEFFKISEINTASNASVLRYWTIQGYDSTVPSPSGYVYPKPTTSINLDLFGLMNVPDLTDSTGAGNGFDAFPVDFHRSVLLKGARLLLAEYNGDGRAGQFDQWFEREMEKLKKRRKNGLQEQLRVGQHGGIPAYRSW